MITIQNDGRGNGLEREHARQGQECTECGQPAKYTYWLVRNDRRAVVFTGSGNGKPFCSISCFRFYSS